MLKDVNGKLAALSEDVERRTSHDFADLLFGRGVYSAMVSSGVGTLRQTLDHAEITHLSVSCESTEGTNSLLMNNPVGSSIVRPVAGTLIFAI